MHYPFLAMTCHDYLEVSFPINIDDSYPSCSVQLLAKYEPFTSFYMHLPCHQDLILSHSYHRPPWHLSLQATSLLAAAEAAGCGKPDEAEQLVKGQEVTVWCQDGVVSTRWICEIMWTCFDVYNTCILIDWLSWTHDVEKLVIKTYIYMLYATDL